MIEKIFVYVLIFLITFDNIYKIKMFQKLHIVGQIVFLHCEAV